MVGVVAWSQECGTRGLYNIAYVQDEDKLSILSSGADGKILLRGNDFGGTPKEYKSKNPSNGICSMLSIRSCFITGNSAGAFSIHKIGDPDFCSPLDNLTSSCPAPALTGLQDGSYVYGAGNHDRILHIMPTPKNLRDSLVRYVVTGKGDIRSLAICPTPPVTTEAGFLAAVLADGSIRIWSLSAKGPVLQKTFGRGTAPQVEGIKFARNGADWHPEGIQLAVPGNENNVLLYNSLSLEEEEEGSLDGAHEDIVNLVAYDRSGKYIVSAGRDCKAVLWDADRREDIRQVTTPAVVSAMAWHPSANCLALICENGQAALWKDVIPRSSASKNAALSSAAASGSGIEDAGEESGQDDEEDRVSADVSHEKPCLSEPVRLPPRRFPAQPPFQPGCTPKGRGATARRFLCYNRMGMITSMKGEGLGIDAAYQVEVVFHDLSKYRKAGHKFTDFHGLSLASLSEKGAMYASKATAKVKGVLMFQPLDIAMGQSWTLGLPEGEDAQVVAAGDTFCAAATSSRLLRIFTHSGVEVGLLSLEGPVVTLAAGGSHLAVVWHRALPHDDGEQLLSYAIYDVPSRQRVSEGRLPLSPGTCLTWLGFSQAGPLATYDSKGVLRILSPHFGGSWVPVFHGGDGNGQSGRQIYWPVGLNHKSFYYVPCTKEDPYPKEKPVQLQEALLVPTLEGSAHAPPSDKKPEGSALHSAFDNTCLDSQALVLTTHIAALYQANKVTEAANLEGDLNKVLLKLFHKAAKKMELAKAMDIVQQFSGPSWATWFDKAQRLANSLRFVVLADQIAGALALRMEEEAAAAAKMLQYSVPAEPSLVSQGYTNDVSRAPTDYGTQCTRNTVPDGGEELHGIRGSSPSGASQHAGQVEPVQLGSATEKASTNIFLRAPLASKANWKENRGPDSRMKDATKETVAAKRKGTNPFALPPAKTVKQ